MFQIKRQHFREIDQSFRRASPKPDIALRIVSGVVAIRRLFIHLIEFFSVLYFARGRLPASQAAKDLASPQPALHPLAQHALYRVQMFLLRPKRHGSLHNLRSMLHRLTQGHTG